MGLEVGDHVIEAQAAGGGGAGAGVIGEEAGDEAGVLGSPLAQDGFLAVDGQVLLGAGGGAQVGDELGAGGEGLGTTEFT